MPELFMKKDIIDRFNQCWLFFRDIFLYGPLTAAWLHPAFRHGIIKDLVNSSGGNNDWF